jgi:hypothetical protein
MFLEPLAIYVSANAPLGKGVVLGHVTPTSCFRPTVQS